MSDSEKNEKNVEILNSNLNHDESNDSLKNSNDEIENNLKDDNSKENSENEMQDKEKEIENNDFEKNENQNEIETNVIENDIENENIDDSIDENDDVDHENNDENNNIDDEKLKESNSSSTSTTSTTINETKTNPIINNDNINSQNNNDNEKEIESNESNKNNSKNQNSSPQERRQRTMSSPTTSSSLKTSFPSIIPNILKKLKPGEDNSNNSSSTSSMTRPSNLPIKPVEEEKKHSKQYLEMLMIYNKKERQKKQEEDKLIESRLKVEKRKIENKKQWELILAKWPKDCKSSKVRKLFWQGIPPNVRGRVWLAALGNDLHITKDLFEIFRKRAADAKQGNVITSSSGNEYPLPLQGREATVALIDLDLPRTFPALSFFQPDGPMAPQLADVLEAYVCYRPDIGYVQGMSYLAAILLLNLETLEAFQCLSHLLNRTVLLEFFKMNQNVISNHMNLLKHLMSIYCPRVKTIFDEQNIVPESFVIDWVLTLFSKSLPLEVATRLWDIYIYEDEVFLFRAILGILRLFSATIQKNDFETNMYLMTHLPPDIEANELLKMISSVSLTSSELASIKLKCGFQ